MMSYRATLIAVAADCPVTRGVVPTERGGKPTVALLQYTMLVHSPSVHTQDDVLFESWLHRQPRPPRARAAAGR